MIKKHSEDPVRLSFPMSREPTDKAAKIASAVRDAMTKEAAAYGTGFWQPIDNMKFINEFYPKHNRKILLATDTNVLGILTSFLIDDHGISWSINSAVYDGDDVPTHFMILPPIPMRST